MILVSQLLPFLLDFLTLIGVKGLVTESGGHLLLRPARLLVSRTPGVNRDSNRFPSGCDHAKQYVSQTTMTMVIGMAR